MAERAHLDAALERNGEARRWAWRQKEAIPFEVAEHFNHDVPALVAELWDAREVVEQARLQYRPHAYLRAALERYDQATTP